MRTAPKNVGPGLAALILLVPAAAAQAQERSWEWGGVVHPVWWPLIVVAAGLVFLAVVAWSLLNLAPLVLAVVAALFGLRWLAGTGERQRSDRAVQILRERYARGDVSRDEYEATMRDLRERGGR